MKNDPDIELCVIGCLLDGGPNLLHKYGDLLRPELFWRDDCRKALEIIVTRDQDGKQTDTVLLNEEWKHRLQNPAPMDLLNSPNMVDVIESLPAYIGELIGRFKITQSRDLIGKLVTKTNHNQAIPVDELKGELESIFDTATTAQYPSFTAKEAVLVMTDDLERRFNLQGKRSGIVTGFKRLDEMLDGIQFAELTVMGARPSHGKTAFALQVLVSSALVQEIPTLFVTMEMSVPSLMRRLLSMTHGIPLKILKTGKMSPTQYTSATAFNAVVSRKPLYFLDAIRGIKSSTLKSKIKWYCDEHGVKIVIGDYMQKIKSDSRHEKRTYEVASVSEALKASAVETGAAFFILAQMSREPDKNKTKDGKPSAPRLCDLADSAQIERDADTVLLLHRFKETNQALITVAKQRDGEIGVIDYTFEGEYVRFQENHETP
jgi:replicative DNA helicase